MIKVVHSKKRPYLRKRKKSILRRRWFWDFILLLIFCGSLLWLILKTPYFVIENIKISGCESIAKKEVRKIALWQKNFFLFNSGNLSASIKDFSPKIQDVKVRKKFPNEVFIKVIERKAAGIYCTWQNKNKRCFLMSKDGVVYELLKETKKKKQAKNEKDKSSLLLISNKEKNNFKAGDDVLDADLFLKFLFLKNELKKFKLFIVEIEIESLQITAKTKNGSKIYFLRGDVFEEQMSVLIKALKKKTIIKPKERKNFKYIDVRDVKDGEKSRIYLR